MPGSGSLRFGTSSENLRNNPARRVLGATAADTRSTVASYAPNWVRTRAERPITGERCARSFGSTGTLTLMASVRYTVPRFAGRPTTDLAGPTNSPTSSSVASTRLSYGREMLVCFRRSFASFSTTRACANSASISAIDGKRRTESETSTPGFARENALASSSPPAFSTHTRASAAFTAIVALSTRSSCSAGSILTNVSLAGIDPPLLNFGEIHATRPVTSDNTRACSSIRTEPVNRTVSPCLVGLGWITPTVGLPFSPARSVAASRATRLGARAK